MSDSILDFPLIGNFLQEPTVVYDKLLKFWSQDRKNVSCLRNSSILSYTMMGSCKKLSTRGKLRLESFVGPLRVNTCSVHRMKRQRCLTMEEQWSHKAASGFDEAASVVWQVALLLQLASVHDMQDSPTAESQGIT